MLVNLNGTAYEMTPAQAEKLIQEASSLVPSGIYAIQKGDYVEMRNDPLDPDEVLAKVQEFEDVGFQVFYN